MAITSVAGTASASTTTPDRFNELNSEQFLKIIFTELGRQDPTQPSDSSKLLEQLSTIRTIQSDIQLSGDLKTIVSQNQLAAAGNTLGKLVRGLTEDGERVSGTVKSVNSNQDGLFVTLASGERLAFSSIDSILEPPATTGGT